jgi:hypothetical protein
MLEKYVTVTRKLPGGQKWFKLHFLAKKLFKLQFFGEKWLKLLKHR